MAIASGRWSCIEVINAWRAGERPVELHASNVPIDAGVLVMRLLSLPVPIGLDHRNPGGRISGLTSSLVSTRPAAHWVFTAVTPAQAASAYQIEQTLMPWRPGFDRAGSASFRCSTDGRVQLETSSGAVRR